MAHYHLYFLRDNKLVGSDHIQAENDDDAALMATRRGDGDAVEVWNAHRRVCVVPPKSHNATNGGTIHLDAG
jgi:hypothetical protein